MTEAEDRSTNFQVHATGVSPQSETKSMIWSLDVHRFQINRICIVYNEIVSKES